MSRFQILGRGRAFLTGGLAGRFAPYTNIFDAIPLEIFDYIGGFYNRVRIHSALGWLSPAEFEARHGGSDRPRAA